MNDPNSLHLDDQVVTVPGIRFNQGARMRRMYNEEQADDTDLFGAFPSVTLHYDGDS
jgi:hypothetical protein